MTIEIIGGCMRLYDTGPEWHVDDDHHTIGIDPTVNPEIDSAGFLTFHNLVPNPIVACSVSPDETLTARGISGGLSNGTDLVRIRLYKDGVNGANGAALNLNDPVHWDRVAGPYCNLWITILHDVPEVPEPAA